MAGSQKARLSLGRKLQIQIEEHRRIEELLDAVQEVLNNDDFLYCKTCGQELTDSEEHENFNVLREVLRYRGARGSEVEDAFSTLSFEEQNSLAQAVKELGVKF